MVLSQIAIKLNTSGMTHIFLVSVAQEPRAVMLHKTEQKELLVAVKGLLRECYITHFVVMAAPLVSVCKFATI